MAGSLFGRNQVPARLRARVGDIAAITADVAGRFLDAEYAELCSRMTAVLARKRPSPLDRGESRSWAAGIIHAVGWVNFLADPSQRPHMTTAELAAATGVGQRTLASMLRKIRDLLDLVQMHPAWTLPSKLIDNPLVWMILVDGVAMDLRSAPRAIQEDAFRQGFIPFVPEPSAAPLPMSHERGDDRERAPLVTDMKQVLRDALDEVQYVLELTLAGHPQATADELNATIQGVMARRNERPQAELGGLSPAAVHALITADWVSAASAIRVEESLTLEELEPAFTLHHARLVLQMFGERNGVKATPKGNLPREFLTEFRERMRQPAVRRAVLRWEPKVLNEIDLLSLHVPRLLLDVAGLIRKRKGAFVRTERGGRLAGDERAGELFATLLRAHFRAFNLGYLDGASDAPEFQQTIGYTCYQFGRMGPAWRTASALTEELLLPSIRQMLLADATYDVASLILETRFLRPLEGFGLAESREVPREPDELITRDAYVKTPLFDRMFAFRLL